jgi:uncharacterized protein YjbI with pentapeptide repeats
MAAEFIQRGAQSAKETTMKTTQLALSIAAVAGSLALAGAAPAHATGGGSGCPMWRCGFNGTSENGIGLNGLTLNGLTLNGWQVNDIKWNGAVIQGAQLNGPGLVLQGASLQGARAPIGECKPGVRVQDCKPGPTAVVLPTGERIKLR